MWVCFCWINLQRLLRLKLGHISFLFFFFYLFIYFILLYNFWHWVFWDFACHLLLCVICCSRVYNIFVNKVFCCCNAYCGNNEIWGSGIWHYMLEFLYKHPIHQQTKCVQLKWIRMLNIFSLCIVFCRMICYLVFEAIDLMRFLRNCTLLSWCHVAFTMVTLTF